MTHMYVCVYVINVTVLLSVAYVDISCILYKGLFSVSISQLTLKSPRTMMFSGEILFNTSVIA